MPNFNNAYGAGLRNGYVRNSDGDRFDIDAIISIEADNDQEDTEVKGDDTIKATFSSGRKEELTVTANGISFDVLQELTGSTLSSSASGQEIPLGTQQELNPPTVEIGGQTNGRAKDGTAVVIEKVYHAVQINSIVVSQENETEFSVEMNGYARQTDQDIEGDALVPSRTSTIHVYQGSVD